MLIELYGKNFGCFRDEFRLSMLATDIDRDNDRGIVRVKIEGDDEPLELLRCVAIYGPNASGKSTVLRAARSLGELIHLSGKFDSDQRLRMYEPFALEPSSGKSSAQLGLKAVVEGQVYDYCIEFNGLNITRERLEQLNPNGAMLIDRDGQEVRGVWKEQDQLEFLSVGLRRNALVLSLADSLAPKVAKSIASTLVRCLVGLRSDAIGKLWMPDDYTARRVADDRIFHQWLSDRVQAADLGISKLRAVAEGTGDDGGKWVRHELLLTHRGAGNSGVIFRFDRESSGTKRLLDYAPILYDLTHSEMVHVSYVDEADNSLHPSLVRRLISECNCESESSSVKGQLVFTTHETSLLDGEARNSILRRDQIYFTDKGADGAARLYSLAEFKERNNLNIRRRYLQGRYGALPALGSFTE